MHPIERLRYVARASGADQRVLVHETATALRGVLLEASACGPDGALTISGGRADAAVAYCAEVPVWLVAGRGRRLPDAMWQALLDRLGENGDPWQADDEVVPIQLVSHVVGPEGL